MTPAPATERLTARQAVVIACAAAATYLVASLGGAVSLVLPRIAADLHFSAEHVQWIITGYLVTRIAGLLPAGTFSDRFGAKRVLVLGMLGFAATAVACGLVSEEYLVIGIRVLQGAFGALLSPSALVLLRLQTPPARLAMAMSVWSAAGMAGFGLSPVLGGWLVDIWGWRAIFLFNGALALLVAILAATLIPRVAALPATTAASPLARELILSVGLAALAFFVGQHDDTGITYLAVFAIAAWVLLKRGAVLRKDSWRLILSLLPQVGVGAFGFAAVAGIMLWASYFIQTDLGRSALVFGLGCIPMAAAGMAACFGTEPLLASRRTNLAFLFSGVSIVAMGVLAYAAQAQGTMALGVAALACGGMAYGFCNASVTHAIMNSFPADQSGDASAIATLSKQFGQLLGITVVAAYRDFSGHVPGSQPMLFYLLAACGVTVLACAALGSAQARHAHARA